MRTFLNIKRWISFWVYVLFRVSSISNSFFFTLPDFQFRTKHRYFIYGVVVHFSIRTFCFSKSDYTDVTVLKVQFNNSCLNFLRFPAFRFGKIFFQIWFHREAQRFYTKTAKKNRFCFAYIFPSELISVVVFRFRLNFVIFYVFDAFCLFKIRWIFRSVTFFLNASYRV
jgi:hypothetical protein